MILHPIIFREQKEIQVQLSFLSKHDPEGIYLPFQFHVCTASHTFSLTVGAFCAFDTFQKLFMKETKIVQTINKACNGTTLQKSTSKCFVSRYESVSLLNSDKAASLLRVHAHCLRTRASTMKHKVHSITSQVRLGTIKMPLFADNI